jgi:DNA-binding MarR family transcriptional regulator
MVEDVLKYLNFSENRLQAQKKYGVDDKEWQILCNITKVYICSGPPIKVRTLIDQSEIASPATIHKAMKKLISKGLIKPVADEFDGRVKYLEPTSRAIKLFDEIGKKMN